MADPIHRWHSHHHHNHCRHHHGHHHHRCLHHLSHPTLVVRVPRSVEGTGPLLRHRLRHLLPPSRPTANIPTGDYLGEMTDELAGDDHIVDFSSGGPKNYGYRTQRGKVECKVRGFTLNVRVSQQLNYDILRQNALDELTHPLDRRRDFPVVNPHFFTRHPATKQLNVSPRTKQYGLVFDKRVVDPVTFRSFPYGYARAAAEPL